MSAASERPAAGRRERKKLQTRRALQRAALRLVDERGIEHVTVEQIADAVDASTRTFFNYFSSKEEALIGHDPANAERLRGALGARPADEPPLESLCAVLCELAVELSGRREEWHQRRRLLRSDPRLLSAHLAAWAALERALVEGMAARTHTDPERDLYPALVVSAAVGATRVAVLRWHADDQVPLTKLVACAFEALGAGLRPPHADRADVTT